MTYIVKTRDVRNLISHGGAVPSYSSASKRSTVRKAPRSVAPSFGGMVSR